MGIVEQRNRGFEQLLDQDQAEEKMRGLSRMSQDGEDRDVQSGGSETDEERAARHERERLESGERYERERKEAHERYERERKEDQERRDRERRERQNREDAGDQA